MKGKFQVFLLVALVSAFIFTVAEAKLVKRYAGGPKSIPTIEVYEVTQCANIGDPISFEFNTKDAGSKYKVIIEVKNQFQQSVSFNCIPERQKYITKCTFTPDPNSPQSYTVIVLGWDPSSGQQPAEDGRLIFEATTQPDGSNQICFTQVIGHISDVNLFVEDYSKKSNKSPSKQSTYTEKSKTNPTIYIYKITQCANVNQPITFFVDTRKSGSNYKENIVVTDQNGLQVKLTCTTVNDHVSRCTFIPDSSQDYTVTVLGSASSGGQPAQDGQLIFQATAQPDGSNQICFTQVIGHISDVDLFVEDYSKKSNKSP